MGFNDRRHSRRADGHAARLLVIDDDDAFRAALSELLRAEGYDVEEADQAATAVSCLKRRRFDVVLSDLIMPGNGHLVAEYVRSYQPQTPVIIISSHASAPDLVANNGAKMVACFQKPVHFEDIQSALQRTLT